jgi:hypothetical protein
MVAATSQSIERARAAWETLFADHAAVFADLREGARFGFVARADFAAIGGRRLAGLEQAGARANGATMLAFEAAAGAMTVAQDAFDGFERARIDLLFVADEHALGELEVAGDARALGVMKRELRRGGLMFYALKPKHELQDAGYEDFLDSLGLAFLGACR